VENPKTAMNIVCFPKGKMEMEVLGEILKAAPIKVKRPGGYYRRHSIIDEEIKYGMAITGVIHPDKIFRNVQACKRGSAHFDESPWAQALSPPLSRREKLRRSVDEAVAFMTTLNAARVGKSCANTRSRLL